MATLEQLRNRILAKVSDGTITNPTVAQVNDQINSTIDFFETVPFWFNQDSASLTCTVGNKVLSTGIPTDFLQFKQDNPLVLLDSDVRYSLIHIKNDEFDALDVGGSGLPRWFTYRNGEIQLYPYPEQAYQVTLYYIKKYPDLETPDDDAETNDFLEHASRLIEYKTLADIFRDYRFDEEKAAIYDGGVALKCRGGKVAGELEMILNQTSSRTTSGRLTTENIIDEYPNY